MKNYEDVEGMEVFLFRPRKFAIRTWFCNCSQYLCLFWHCRVGSPKSASLLSSFHIGSRFCFFPANFLPSTYTDKNNPFWWCTKRHSQFGIFSQPRFNWIFSHRLSHNSPAKRWPYRLRSRGTNGSSILDHDLGHLCRGRRIQMSGHSDLGIFNNLWASSIFHFYLGISWYCVNYMSRATRQSGVNIHDFFCCLLWCWWSFLSEYCISSRVVCHNITSEYNTTFVLLVFRLQFSIFQVTYVH